MFNFLRKAIPDNHPVRLLFHKLKAVLAALVYWFPGDKMIVIGVTGTNGKTTTVNLITNILNAAGYKVGMMSTINFQVGDKRWPNITKQTTASPFVIQKMLRQMVREDCKYAVLEVSSHAVTQSRIYGVTFDVGVLTNISEDHIEYHGSFDAYLDAKLKFFEKLSKSKRKTSVSKTIILNADEEYFGQFDQFVCDRKLTYGLKAATVYATNVEKNPKGSRFEMHVPNAMIDLTINMPGEFNIYNSLAAAAVCVSLNVTMDDIKNGLKESSSVAGRMESVEQGQNFNVIVDYAHTPEALDGILSMYRKLTAGNLYVVFGATGGGRDKVKRPKMGGIVDEYADFIIVTDDDPYSEDELEIIEHVSKGIARKEGERFWKIPDRREAIRMALTLAKENDTVVIAGKGAEEVMMVRGKTIPWSDKQVVTEILDREINLELGSEELIKVRR